MNEKENYGSVYSVMYGQSALFIKFNIFLIVQLSGRLDDLRKTLRK